MNSNSAWKRTMVLLKLIFMDLELNVERCEITPCNRQSLLAELRGVDMAEVLSQIDIRSVINYYGEDKLLDEIGQPICEDHFNLKPNDE